MADAAPGPVVPGQRARGRADLRRAVRLHLRLAVRAAGHLRALTAGLQRGLCDERARAGRRQPGQRADRRARRADAAAAARPRLRRRERAARCSSSSPSAASPCGPCSSRCSRSSRASRSCCPTPRRWRSPTTPPWRARRRRCSASSSSWSARSPRRSSAWPGRTRAVPMAVIMVTLALGGLAAQRFPGPAAAVEPRAMTLVTISAAYGSGGSIIAPALAERLRRAVPRPPAGARVVDPGQEARGVRRVGRVRAGPPAVAHGLARRVLGDARRDDAGRAAARPGPAAGDRAGDPRPRRRGRRGDPRPRRRRDPARRRARAARPARRPARGARAPGDGDRGHRSRPRRAPADPRRPLPPCLHRRRSTASICTSPASATSCSTRPRSRSRTASSSSPRRPRPGQPLASRRR